MKTAFIKGEPGTDSYHWRVPVELRETVAVSDETRRDILAAEAKEN